MPPDYLVDEIAHPTRFWSGCSSSPGGALHLAAEADRRCLLAGRSSTTTVAMHAPVNMWLVVARTARRPLRPARIERRAGWRTLTCRKEATTMLHQISPDALLAA